MTPVMPRTGRPSYTAQAVFIAFLGVFAAAVAVLASRPTADSFDYMTAGAFALAFFVMRLVALRLPQGDEVAITVVVGLPALGVLTPLELMAAAFVAVLFDTAARLTQGPLSRSVGRALDAVRSLAVLAILTPWHVVLRPLLGREMTDTSLVPVLLAGITYVTLDIVTIAVQQRLAGGVRVMQGVPLLARSLASIYLVHLAMASVVLRVYPVLGLWAFAIALLLTLILQNSFNMYMRIRRAYAETISALAHAAELDRPQDSGHARRVADLSVAVGRELDISGHALEQLGYAALLHDIGRIGHQDESGVDHAIRGAEIVAPIPFLSDIAPLIEHQRDTESDDVPVGAAIVGVCSRYDRLRGTGGAERALNTLLAEEHGERRRVVEVLRRVVIARQAEAGTLW
jgi:hypothetical protein